MTKSYQELREQSERFIEFLHKQNIDATLDDDTFRDYNVKIKLLGVSCILYHKPSKQTFSIGCHHISDQLLQEKIQKLWYQFLFPEDQETSAICAYVDGSCMHGKIGWGLVVVERNEVIYQEKGIVPLSEEEGSRQIAGEIYAVLHALEYAQTSKHKSLTVFYDYKGLEMWATRQWKAVSSIAQFYVTELMKYHISIIWKKIIAHTGHIFNEQADRLAKQAISEHKID
ncbi:MAG: RNase H family protein [Brevinema sp.]